jgi:DNA-binding XRE family transcriptional regulator
MKKSPAKNQFTPLNTVIAKELKNERFRKSFSEEMSRLQLAHEIKTLRQRRKMTQAEVATKTDMPQSVIARIESGTHSFSIATLHKIAQVFDKHVGLVGQTQNRR